DTWTAPCRAALRSFLRGFELDAPSNAEAVAVYYLYLRQYSEAARYLAVAKEGHRAASVVPDAWTRFNPNGHVDRAPTRRDTALAARPPPDARVRGLLARHEWFDGHHPRALELIQGMDPAGAWLPPDLRFPAALAAGQGCESMGR